MVLTCRLIWRPQTHGGSHRQATLVENKLDCQARTMSTGSCRTDGAGGHFLPICGGLRQDGIQVLVLGIPFTLLLQLFGLGLR